MSNHAKETFSEYSCAVAIVYRQNSFNLYALGMQICSCFIFYMMQYGEALCDILQRNLPLSHMEHVRYLELYLGIMSLAPSVTLRRQSIRNRRQWVLAGCLTEY